MQLHDYLRIARRHWALLLVLPLLLGIGGWFYSSSKPDQFQASSLVLLRPNDPGESVGTAGSARNGYVDLVSFAQSQIEVLNSPAVSQLASAAVAGTTPDQIDAARSVAATRNSTVLKVTCQSTNREFVAPCADALASGYIASRRSAARASLESAIGEVNKQLETITTELQDLTKKVGKTVPDASTQAAIDAATARFRSLTDQQGQLSVNINLKRGEAELISAAKSPLGPFAPTPSRTAALGVMLGLLAAAGLAIARDQLDNKVRSSAQLETATGLPVLTRLPSHAKVESDSTFLPMTEEPFSPFSERIRDLRTSVKFLGASQELRSIVVTSSVPGEGKSLVAANLAVSIAQTGSRVLLLSADLRKPRLDTLFGNEYGGKGLSDLITDLATAQRAGHNVDVREAVCEAADATQTEGLFIIRAGALPPNPNELLGSATMRSIIGAAHDLFDMVIMDTPPLAAVSDALVVGSDIDGVLIVASAKKTDRRLVAQSVEQVRAAGLRIVGTVLNRTSSRGKGYGYGYGYAYKQGYGPEPVAKPKSKLRGKALEPVASPSLRAPAQNGYAANGHAANGQAANELVGASAGGDLRQAVATALATPQPEAATATATSSGNGSVLRMSVESSDGWATPAATETP
jgi:capsular exopolysaccharide synthesis family protein